jgi:uncharacterized protein
VPDINLAAIASTVVWGAFFIGLIFGFVGNRTNFCTMGAVADIVNMGDWDRMRMWLLAIAVAVLGTTALQSAGLIDTAKSIYTGKNLLWLSAIVGGFLFGFGMTLGSGCGSKTLIRIGGGSLKSLVVFLVMGITAYATLKGLFGVFRVATLDPVALSLGTTQDLPAVVAKLLGAERKTMLWIIAGGLALGLLVFVFKSRGFATANNVAGGLIIGAVVVAGWYVSGKLGYVAEDPNTLQEAFVATNSGRMESLTYVAPIAYSIELFIFFSDKSKVLTFGIASVAGIVLGSFIYAWLGKSFRWEGFANAEDTANHLVGGVLMGFGGVTAMGCTIGQGLTGISTLAISSFLAFLAIVAGCVAALKYQVWRVEQMG